MFHHARVYLKRLTRRSSYQNENHGVYGPLAASAGPAAEPTLTYDVSFDELHTSHHSVCANLQCREVAARWGVLDAVALH